MNDRQHIIDCYDRTAGAYAERFLPELEGKHLDRLLLRAFAEESAGRRLIDLGCGPGQTTRFLHDNGAHVLGTDLSPRMIEEARAHHPGIDFETADLLQLPYADGSFGAAVAFYAIVHFTPAEVAQAFHEVYRVLMPGSPFLLSFHVGTESIRLDRFLDQDVRIDFHFFEPAFIVECLSGAGFRPVDVIERAPYDGIEHASQRAYLWVTK